jgi:hypothetical protein
MRRVLAHSSAVWLLLVASLAFNVGFGAMFGVRTYEQRRCRIADPGDLTCCLTDTLGLTAAQAEQMRAGQEKLVQEINASEQVLTAVREALAELLAAPQPDRTAIAAQLDQIAAQQRHIQGLVIEHLLTAKESLTDAQRDTFDRVIRVRVCPRGGPVCGPMPGGCMPQPETECPRRNEGG